MASLVVSSNLIVGQLGGISGIAIQIPDTSDTRQGFDIVADSGNTGIIYVGVQGLVTGSGFPMRPSESRHFALDTPSRVWVISNQTAGTAVNRIFWVGQ